MPGALRGHLGAGEGPRLRLLPGPRGNRKVPTVGAQAGVLALVGNTGWCPVPQPETLVLELGDLSIVYSEVSATPVTSSLAAQGRICGVLGRVPTRGWTGPSHVRTCPLRPPRPTLHVCDGLRPVVCEPLGAPGPASPHPGPLLHPVPRGSPGRPTPRPHAPLPCPGSQIRRLDRVLLPWEPSEAGWRLRDPGSSCRSEEATPAWESGRVTEGRVDTPFANGYSSAEGLPTNSDWRGMARSVEGVERWEVICRYLK